MQSWIRCSGGCNYGSVLSVLVLPAACTMQICIHASKRMRGIGMRVKSKSFLCALAAACWQGCWHLDAILCWVLNDEQMSNPSWSGSHHRLEIESDVRRVHSIVFTWVKKH
jgi:hypothetical protein